MEIRTEKFLVSTSKVFNVPKILVLELKLKMILISIIKVLDVLKDFRFGSRTEKSSHIKIILPNLLKTYLGVYFSMVDTIVPKIKIA